AKFLERAGRTEVPIAIGKSYFGNLDKVKDLKLAQSEWVKDYNLDDFSGKLYKDSTEAIYEVIDQSYNSRRSDDKTEMNVKIVGIGPLTSIADLIENHPEIIERTTFVGMHGSIYKGYGGSSRPSAEYNIKADIAAARKVFSSNWEKVITPLDTCGEIYLKKDFYKQLYNSNKIIPQLIIENYKVWGKKRKVSPRQIKKQSSCLFDTVAIYLSYSRENLVFETLKINIDDNGVMVPKKLSETKSKEEGVIEGVIDNSWTISAAISWQNKKKFYKHLVKRLNA
ncbi:MAG: nucleoside hydrolase, partial [Promethearchaeota archaeon]